MTKYSSDDETSSKKKKEILLKLRFEDEAGSAPSTSIAKTPATDIIRTPETTSITTNDRCSDASLIVCSKLSRGNCWRSFQLRARSYEKYVIAFWRKTRRSIAITIETRLLLALTCKV